MEIVHKPIVILTALEKELKPLLSEVKKKKTIVSLKHFTLYSGYIPKVTDKIYFGVFGIGKVQAALFTQYVIDNIKPLHIFLMGTCGGATRNVKSGDIIIPNETVQIDFDITCFDNLIGEFEGPIENLKYRIFKTDTKIINWAKASDKTNLIKIQKLTPNVLIGRFATQDKLEVSVESLKTLENKYDFLGIDMEAAAVNIVASFNSISFNAIKGVLDEGGVFDKDFYNKYFNKISKNSYIILKSYLQSS